MKNLKKLSKAEMREINGGGVPYCNETASCTIPDPFGDFGGTLGMCKYQENVCGCSGWDSNGQAYFKVDWYCSSVS